MQQQKEDLQREITEDDINEVTTAIFAFTAVCTHLYIANMIKILSYRSDKILEHSNSS